MQVEAAVAAELAGAGPVALAVSGGVDSMVMMHAAARTPGVRIAAVATFDHGTGAAATRAVARVARAARALGLPVRRGRARGRLRGETQWRAARLAFLAAVASELHARIATAHTLDDQLETVVLRVLRGSGARGLAGLFARGAALRPLLRCTRADVLAYARAHALAWSDDPTNASRAHLRNRVRHDLLPALERAHPGFGQEMLALASRAAALRDEIDAEIARAIPMTRDGGALAVARASLLRYDANGLALLWPAIAARAGVALDRRGVHRLVTLAREGHPGARTPLAGGFEAVLHRGRILVRRASPAAPSAAPDAVRVDGSTARLGGWRLGPAPFDAASLWTAALPAGAELTLRAWRPGDRMTPVGATAPRRVKGLLRDAGIDAARREGWPVLLAGEEIVWIPGVRRSDAATERSGRPMVSFSCERDDER